ncbi:MAG: MBL fold metallo-hydrolase [Armatimonadetes bacterium]|nr:MBL fold metallo-hydrolase [Armatimonadota bacterium]
MRIRFWGVRGSIPTPSSAEEIEHKLVQALLGARGVDLEDEAAVRRYVSELPLHSRGCWGGNTTCLQITTNSGDNLIIDAGSGLRPLGEALLADEFGRGEGHAVMLFTHTHWDHIQGFPFFKPLFIPGNRFDIYARHELIEERLRYQHDSRFFPVGLDVMAAQKSFHLIPERVELFDGRVVVSSIGLDHPGVAYAYRIEADGHSFVMASDGEYKELAGDYWQRYVDFYRDADVLVFDAQYTLREALVEKQNWGHSSAMIGIDLASDAKVKTIVMVHHEPSYDDDKIKRIFDDALRYLDRMPSVIRPVVLVGYEGLLLDL